jgi:hypothetical protein
VTIATRFPLGSGWCDRSDATSKSPSSVRVRMTPDWRRSAPTTASLSARAPVCEDAARAPARDRPAFTTTIGFERETRRAIGPKFRGFPKLSR